MNEAAAAIWMVVDGHEVCQIIACKHRQEVIEDGGRENTPHHRRGLVARREGHGQQLGLVPHLGEYHKTEGGEKSSHVVFLSRAKKNETRYDSSSHRRSR